MNNINEKALDKIKKLLELASSPNENEAKLAMDQARRLMAKYSIDDKELGAPDRISELIVEEPYINSAFSNDAVLDAIPIIIAVIAPIFGVYGLVNTRNGQARQFKLIGFKTNIEIARFAIDSLIAQGLIDAKREYKKYRTITFMASFWTGFKEGLHRKFGKMEEENKGIVLYDKVKQYVDSLASGASFAGRSTDGVAYQSGFNSGQNASIRSAINSSSGAASSGKLIG